MRKSVKYSFIALIVLVCISAAAVSIVIWAWNTAQGTRALLKTISLFSPVHIEAEEISGRFKDELKMRGLRIVWPQGRLDADLVHLRWEAAELWNRQVMIHDLSFEGVHLQDNRPEAKEISFRGWPAAPFWLTRLKGRVESLQVHTFFYQRLGNNPESMEKVFARILWDGETLTVSDFSAVGAPGKAEGVMRISLPRPALILNMRAEAVKEHGGFDSFLVNVHLARPEDREEASGDVLISAQKKGVERLQLRGDLHVNRSALRFRDFRIFRPGQSGTFQGEGEVFLGPNPTFQLKANFAALNLIPELGRTTDLSGNLELKGSQKAYQGRISMANVINGWQGGKASALFRGNLEGLEITQLDAAWLAGEVKGFLKIFWDKELSIEAELQGRNLNPALVSPDLNGVINLNLKGKFFWPKTKIAEGAFKADLLPSRMYDTDLTGDLTGGLKNNLLNIGRLRLRGPGFDLQARGVLQEKVLVGANIKDLSRLIPEATGRLTAAGWARFKDNRLTAILTGQGNDFSIQKISARSFRAHLQLKEFSVKAQPDAFLEFRAENLQAGPVPMESAHLILSGSPSAHRASLSLQLRDGEIQSEVSGSYDRGSWKGMIEKLNAREPHGLWNLPKPTVVILSSKQFHLSPLTLESTKRETIRAQADLSLKPISGALLAQWESIDLARANPWIPSGNLSGQTTGSTSVQWSRKGPQISGETNFKGAFTRDRLKVEVSSGQMKLDWGEKGLFAAAEFGLTQGGILEAGVSSAEPFQTSFPKEGKIDARWKSVDLGLLIPLLPEDLVFKGQSSGQLKGGWFPGSRFEAAGSMRTSQGRVTWKAKDKKPISTHLNAAEMDFSWRGESLQGNLSLLSAEYGSLKATFLLPLSARFSPSLHPEGPLKVSLQGLLQEEGLLAALYPERIQDSGGKLQMNLDAEGTWGNPRLKGTVHIFDLAVQSHPRASEGKNAPTAPLLLKARSGSASVDWGPHGLAAQLNIDLTKNGRIDGRVSSPEPAGFALPKDGKADLSWTGLDLAVLQPFMAERILVEGQAAAQIQLKLLPGRRLEADGGFKVARGKLSWTGDHGLITAGLNHSTVDFLWRGERLEGKVNLTLENYGFLKGSFLLPFPARPPFQFVSGGPLQVSLEGQAQERGLLSAIFPGMIEETRGDLDVSFNAGGIWGKPILFGTLQLNNAGAYLPKLGIHVQDVSTRWKMQGDQIQIESFQARSGPGRLEGTGTLWLKDGQIERYQGRLTGENFQTLYHPDLRIQSSPKLDFQGTPGHLSVRGEILLPDVQIYEMSKTGMAQTSSDVVIVDQPPEQRPPRSLDVEVKVILGEKVQVKTAGIDTRLAGSLELKALSMKPGDITARGEVRAVGGLYSGYRLNLRIERGRAIYAGGPVDNPGLDVLALKKSVELERRDIRVGVAILGNLKHPNVKLYSQPAMKDEDILSYILLDRPYDPKQGNLALLLTGAGGLLSGSSPGIIDKLKGELGIDTLDIQSSTAASGTSGTSSSATEEFQRSLVTVGKYLSPDLYISYGYSVFTNEQLLTLRYQISKHWEIETKRGNALGLDLYYRINFY